jgi:hypothetical protein
MRLGHCTVPDGESGDWSIKSFSIGRNEALLHNIGVSHNGAMFVSPGSYKKLVHKKRGVIMSNTRMEIISNYEAYRLATGRVLINGLGMGMLLEAILTKPDVTYVKVIEKETDVIKLVAPHFAGDPRVEIVQADAYSYEPPASDRFHYAWHDVWDDLCADNLPLMAKLTRKWRKPRAERQGVWSRHMVRANARRYR